MSRGAGNERARAVLALLTLPRVGRTTARNVLEWRETELTSSDELRLALHEARRAGVRVPDVSEVAIASAFKKADEVLRECEQRSIAVWHVEASDDQHWLARFAAVHDPPIILFARGDTDMLAKPAITIVGTRNPTSYGADVATKIAKRCANAGFSVVSGLAFGCDVAAHQGALDAGGRTAAVLAHGLDEIHPSQHSEVATAIVESSGCLLSEYPPGSRPQPRTFVERDRLQSAAGLGVIVVETGAEGGTMHTVRFAKAQGRKIGCIVHPPEFTNEPSVQGNQALLDEGAVPISGPEDLDLSRFLDESLIPYDDTTETHMEESQDREPPEQGSLFD